MKAATTATDSQNATVPRRGSALGAVQRPAGRVRERQLTRTKAPSSTRVPKGPSGSAIVVTIALT